MRQKVQQRAWKVANCVEAFGWSIVPLDTWFVNVRLVN